MNVMKTGLELSLEPKCYLKLCNTTNFKIPLVFGRIEMALLYQRGYATRTLLF